VFFFVSRRLLGWRWRGFFVFGLFLLLFLFCGVLLVVVAF
jgi:hypothetical protein